MLTDHSSVLSWSRRTFADKLRRIVAVACQCLIVAGSMSVMAQQPSVTEQAAAPMPAEEAAKSMIVPDGFKVTVFAAEPDVMQPVGFCFDDRGRMWVAEAYNYPNHGDKPGDRIIILEDADGDGKFDKRSVFYDQLNYVTGIEVGFGGAWVMSPPNFYFIPDRDGNDVPDSEPIVLLDGFGNHANSHNLANGFAWGPDGWLYGTHGRTNYSRIAKPGTPDAERKQFDGGVYRYHPIKHMWEPYADGTTNPWGIDWDEFGEAFVSNCVNPHLFHVIYGAHYEPWRNRESSRFAYQRIDTIADHLHYLGSQDFHAGIGSAEEDELGGGHAHCGLMVYLGDNWPDQYRGSIFMNNIHGKRVNQDKLEHKGSGYKASHRPDVIRSKDPWHVGVNIAYGPDGGVFVSDWSDIGECHSVRNTQRETGRIYKVTYGDVRQPSVNVARLSNDELVQLHLHRNEWFVRHARRVLQERAAAGMDMTLAASSLRNMFAEQKAESQKLRALWTLHAINEIDDAFLLEQVSHPSEYVRGWVIRLLCENYQAGQSGLKRLQTLATYDNSKYVLLQLASALQRLPLADRWGIAKALMSRDAGLVVLDSNLPLMYWYAIEPLVDEDMAKFAELGKAATLPLIQNHVARRLASHSQATKGLDLILAQLESEAGARASWLEGTLKGLEGRRSVPMPKAWSNVFEKIQASEHNDLKLLAIELGLVFGDARALPLLRSLVIDVNQKSYDRSKALRSLVSKKAAGTGVLLIELLDDEELQRDAIRGLAEFNETATPVELLKRYKKFSSYARQDALQTLTSRRDWAAKLMDAIESQQIDRQELTAFTTRQLVSLNDDKLLERVKNVWGELRSTPADKAKLIAEFKKRLTPQYQKHASMDAGQKLFSKHCANCHQLLGSGGKIGPDLTGSQRFNLDYLLENLIDPSAAVSKDFQMEVVLTDSGRVITGMIVDENEQSLAIQTANEKVVVPTEEVEERTLSKVSMMPEGILQALTPAEVRDLLHYLANAGMGSTLPDKF